MLPFPIAFKQETKSGPISADHPVRALASCLPRRLCVAGTAVMISCIWHVCGTFILWDSEGWVTAPVAGAATNRCCEHCKRKVAVSARISHQQGCWQSSVVIAQKPESLWASTGALQPDLENAGNLHVFQKEVESGCSFLNPSFLSSSYLATCPTGTTLRKENRLDDPFYEQAKWGLKPFCPTLPANQQ